MHLLNQRPEITPPIDLDSKSYSTSHENHPIAVLFAANHLRFSWIFYCIMNLLQSKKDAF
jgi:hypothetical protein